MSYVNLARILKGSRHPGLGFQYLRYCISGQKLRAKSGKVIGGFLDFNEYLGTFANQPGAQEIAAFDLLQKKNPIVFDVGANIGVFSLAVLSRMPDAALYCFEPAPLNYDRLELNIKRNGHEARLFPLAFSDHGAPSTLSFAVSPESPSTMHFSEIGQSDGLYDISVQVTTLDQFCDKVNVKGIDLLKVDVEGYEVDVLEGARGLLKLGAIQHIFIEVCPGNLIRAGTSVRNLFDCWTAYSYEAYPFQDIFVKKRSPLTLKDIKNYECENVLLLPANK